MMLFPLSLGQSAMLSRKNPASPPRPATNPIDIPKKREVIPQYVYQNGYSSPFMDACGSDDLTKMHWELKHGVNPLKPNVFGKTPLMVTAAAGNLNAAQYLLSMIPARAARKHYIDRQNESGHTALMMAAREGRLDMVKFLCQLGASLIKTNNKKQTALDIAIEHSHVKVADLLRLKKAYSRNLSWSPMGSALSSPVFCLPHSTSMPLERRKPISGLSEVFASRAEAEAERPANPFHSADKPSSSQLAAPTPRRPFREPSLSPPRELLEPPPENIEAERQANLFHAADTPSSSRLAAPTPRRPFREPSLSPPRELLEPPPENKATPPACLPFGPIGFLLSKLLFSAAT